MLLDLQRMPVLELPLPGIAVYLGLQYMDISIGPLVYSMDNNHETNFRSSTWPKNQDPVIQKKFSLLKAIFWPPCSNFTLYAAKSSIPMTGPPFPFIIDVASLRNAPLTNTHARETQC